MKVRQTFQFPGRESPFLRTYYFQYIFDENREMSLVCSSLDEGPPQNHGILRIGLQDIDDCDDQISENS